MEWIKINLKNPGKKEIDLIVNFLNQGKVIACPTDTVYGLGCLATDAKAIRRIFKIKKRENRKPLLILTQSLAMAKKYCRINKKQAVYLKKVWPGPVSVVLEDRRNLPKELSAGQGALAVRLPRNDFLLKIIKKLGEPLVSTSLNLSGEPVISDLGNVEIIFKKEKPDLIVDAGVLKGKPSRLVDLRDAGNIMVLR
ncbi:MAG: L-threonylcarbamoyladenylate synthase [Patescibacteria group bacterium]|jgi:tRNA threonylcarbamoyl adenosine modification protein (Sua5/YciO/YrdC/YwlC family)